MPEGGQHPCLASGDLLHGWRAAIPKRRRVDDDLEPFHSWQRPVAPVHGADISGRVLRQPTGGQVRELRAAVGRKKQIMVIECDPVGLRGQHPGNGRQGAGGGRHGRDGPGWQGSEQPVRERCRIDIGDDEIGRDLLA